MINKLQLAVFLGLTLIAILSFSACTPTSNGNTNGVAQEKTQECRHDYSVLLSDTATCEEDGTAIYQCAKCSETIEQQSKATGHLGVISCDKCEKRFVEILFPDRISNTFEIKDGQESIRTSISLSLNDEELIINDYTSYNHSASSLLCYSCTTVFTIQKDGSWSYSLKGKSNSANYGWECNLTGFLEESNLYSYTKKNVQDVSFELPVGSIQGDSSYAKAMYLTLKLQFKHAVQELEKACNAQQNVSMKNLGFTQY